MTPDEEEMLSEEMAVADQLSMSTPVTVALGGNWAIAAC